MKNYLQFAKSLLGFKAKYEKAYIGNFWAELASTTIYVATFIIFTGLLFAKIGNFAGYSKDDFLFMTLIGQASFYCWALIMFPTFTRIVGDVRSGTFDLVLLRPLSIRFYMYVSSIRPIYAVFVSVPNIVLLVWIIKWSQLTLTIGSVLLGAIVWLCGMLILNTIMLGLASPVFMQGDATDMVNTAYTLFSVTQVPYEKLPNVMKFLGFAAIPTLLATAGGGYVMLQKGPALPLVIASCIAGAIAVVCFNKLWRKCMNSYSSASS